MKKIIPIFTFLLLWAGWYFCYPCHLRWLEGFSFFTTLPDFIGHNYDLPGDLFRYLGSFLLQFYAVPAVGAAIQAAFPVLVILCLYVAMSRLFENKEGLMCISFSALPFLVFGQMDDVTLERSVLYLSLAIVLVLVVFALTFRRRPFRSMPAFLRNRFLLFAVLLIPMGVSVSVMLDNSRLNSQHEEQARLEYWAENRMWYKILEDVSVQDAMRSDYKKKYVLMALSESGKLAEYAFRYGLSSWDDFVYNEPVGPFECKFNMLFYRGLGMDNPVVHNSFEHAVNSFSGLTFDSMRMLVDVYLERKDYEMAEKYIEILRHTTCHSRWIKERLPLLEQIKGAEPVYNISGDKFMMDYFLLDMLAMVDRYEGNEKFADYLMCGVLAERELVRFFKFFSELAPTLYHAGMKIPRLYQEAILILAAKQPEILHTYNVDYEVMEDYSTFMELIRQGNANQARRKFAGTYWAYVY